MICTLAALIFVSLLALIGAYYVGIGLITKGNDDEQ